MEKQRIVVKVGTSTLTRDNGALNLHNMDHLARALSDLRGMGHEIVLVSSGVGRSGVARSGRGKMSHAVVVGSLSSLMKYFWQNLMSSRSIARP